MTPKLTNAGKNLLLRALAGETITFTKIQLGNGSEQSTADSASLDNPLLTVNISKIATGTDYVTLTAQFTNSAISNGFHITEAGFFAKDPDDDTKEILYAIGNESESSADYVPSKDDRLLEVQFDALIFIGDAENVSAAISSSLVYAAKDDFDEHTADQSNPHGVTKEQVGLGNVPNLAPGDQVPTFTEATTFANIESGEKASTLFGKIKLAIYKLIAHIDNRSNPHNCTASQVGAAPKNHEHNVSDLKSGVLPLERGGTGVTSLDDLSKLIVSKCVCFGTYLGDGDQGREISLGFYPQAVYVCCADSNIVHTDETTGSKYCAGGIRQAFALRNKNALRQFENSSAGTPAQYMNQWNDDYCLLGITENGFMVNQNKAQQICTNDQSHIYYYVAIK